MARNQNLTRAIGGRTVQVATAESGKLFFRCDDQSTMQVKTAGRTRTFPPGGTIKAIHAERPTIFVSVKVVIIAAETVDVVNL
jgi:hypothetical protein